MTEIFRKDDFPTTVLYHAHCRDGLTAAWVYKTFHADRHGYKDVVYKPVNYGQDIPSGLEGRKVVLLDFCYKRPQLEEIARQAVSLVIVDHHKTAAEELAGFQAGLPHNVSVVFDQTQSGCGLAWSVFGLKGACRPLVVRYAEDRDLWAWKLPFSREINAVMASYPMTFEAVDNLDIELESDLPESRDDDKLGSFILQGEAILRYQDQLVGGIVATASWIRIAGFDVKAANTSTLFSDVAGKLAERRPFGVAWFLRTDGKIQFSLRSRDDGIDVSEVAKQFGGGGHRNAAGFELSVEDGIQTVSKSSATEAPFR